MVVGNVFLVYWLQLLCYAEMIVWKVVRFFGLKVNFKEDKGNIRREIMLFN